MHLADARATAYVAAHAVLHHRAGGPSARRQPRHRPPLGGRRRVATHRDEGGRRLIDGRDLAAFSVEIAQGGTGEDEASYTSARNAFPGIVTAVKLGDVAAQVEIQAGPHRLVSLLTREAVEELGLEVGMQATARVKSTNVHIDRT